MLRSRLLAGGLLSCVSLAALYGDMMLKADYLFGLYMTVAMTVVLYELYTLCRMRDLTPFVKFGLVMGVVLMVLRWVSLPGTLEIFLPEGAATMPEWVGVLMGWGFRLGLVAAVFGSLWLQATKRDNAKTFESISTTLFGLLYVVLLGGFLLDIRRLNWQGIPGGDTWYSSGALYLFVTVGVTKLCDVGAYTFGLRFGKHKMIPRISPKKTYEGAAGGILFGVASALIFYWVDLFPVPSVVSAVIFAVIVSVVGMYGDLAESLLKRGSGSKDSGALVPGFGGVLDVADSLLVSAPVAYLVLVVMLG
ncbi:MAG: phosphatidate cytidylyltransferase [Planctomycetes bacterium]|nr:phosphatidate cytidylyltransferase [Planctomycetota bacterium]